MAHSGRIYPLTGHRCFNADAPYPFWAARGYTIYIPLATGFYAYLSSRFYRAHTPSIAAGYLTYDAVEDLIPGLTRVVCRLRIGWTNMLPNPRLTQVTLFWWNLTSPLGPTLLQSWQSEDIPTYALDHLQPSAQPPPIPADFLTFGAAQCIRFTYADP